MSAKMMAASTAKRSTGWRVTFSASSGVLHISRMPCPDAHLPVLGQVAPGLAHEPHRGASTGSRRQALRNRDVIGAHSRDADQRLHLHRRRLGPLDGNRHDRRVRLRHRGGHGPYPRRDGRRRRQGGGRRQGRLPGVVGHLRSRNGPSTSAALQEGLAARMAELATLIATEVGMPHAAWPAPSRSASPSWSWAPTPNCVDDFPFEEQVGHSLVVREPVGVVGAITPWNYPLHQIVAKVAPALAAGCTVVLKPSEVAPLNAFVLAEIVDEVGLPAGVFNLVTGTGPVVGEAIAAHPDVDMVSFTGSTRAGKRVGRAGRGHRQAGGPRARAASRANVILDDADLERAVSDRGEPTATSTPGQTCTAWTRMLVPRDRLAEAEPIAAARRPRPTASATPLSEDTNLGPLVSAAQQERVRGYIDKGAGRGRQAGHGRGRGPRGPRPGLLRPAHGLLRRRPRHDHRPGGDLRAGPVDHALRQRGGGDRDRQRHRLRAGRRRVVGRPGAGPAGRPPDAHRTGRRQRRPASTRYAPFGGYKQSGIGRELGRHGLEEYLETKSLQL